MFRYTLWLIAGLRKMVGWVSRVFLRRNPTNTAKPVGLRRDKAAANPTYLASSAQHAMIGHNK